MDAVREMLTNLGLSGLFFPLFVAVPVIAVLLAPWKVAAPISGIMGALFVAVVFSEYMPLGEIAWDFVALVGGVFAVAAGLLAVIFRWFAGEISRHMARSSEWLRQRLGFSASH